MNKLGYRQLLVLSLSLLMLTGCAGGNEENSSINPSDNSNNSSQVSSETFVPVETTYKVKLNTTGSNGTRTEPSSFSCEGELSVKSVDNIFFVGETIKDSIRFGTSNKTGTMVIKVPANYVVTKVKVGMKPYGKDNSTALKVSLSNGENHVIIPKGEYASYDFNFTKNTPSSEVTLFNSNKGQRVYVNSIEITLLEQGSTPTPGTSDSEEQTDSSSSTHVEYTSIGPEFDSLIAQIADPNNDSYSGSYYSAISSSLEGNALISKLEPIIEHTDQGYDALWEGYKSTDTRSDGTVWDIYSNTKYLHITDKAGNYHNEGDCYNREHTIPKSWFNDKAPMHNDIHQVMPSDGFVNNWRSNYAYGEVVDVQKESTNGCKLGTDVHGDIVFEPCDEFKGDLARNYFYMVTRYRSQVGSWTYNENGKKVFQGSYPYIQKNPLDIYVRWALQDPVSQKEIDRNNAAYEYQGNRNPYIDHPSYFYKAFVKGNYR